MKLDLGKTETVPMRPILIVVKDAEARPAILILDNVNLDHLSSPFPGDEESESIGTGLDLLVPTSLHFRHDGEKTLLRLEDESATALELAFPPLLINLLPSGGKILWRPQRTRRQHARSLRRPKTRQTSLLAVLLQDVHAPAVSRLVCPDESCADEFDELTSPHKSAAPWYLIDTVRMFLKPGLNGLSFRILANDDRDRPFNFEGTLQFDFMNGGPLHPERN